MEIRNGVYIPDIGFGTWNIDYGKVCETAVKEAIKAGYRLIDTAGAYGNEKSVGLGIKQAIAEGYIKDRSEVFVTSKLWNTNRSYNKAFKAFEKSQRNLDLDYIDLYLIHWPANRKRYKEPERVNAETWKALEELMEKGRVRAIGVSNFMPHHIEELKKTANILPLVNQLELHIGYMQEEACRYNSENDIVTEAYSPLGTGQILSDKKLDEMAEKYHISLAELCLSFLRGKDIIPLPKTLSPERMAENLLYTELGGEDIAYLEAFSFIGGHAHKPDEVDF